MPEEQLRRTTCFLNSFSSKYSIWQGATLWGDVSWAVSLDNYLQKILHWGFPDSSVGKESTCNAGDPSSIPMSGRYPGEGIGYLLQYSWASLVAQLVKNPPAMQQTWVGKIPWWRERLPTPVFWPGEFHGLYSSWGHKELDMTEWLSLSGARERYRKINHSSHPEIKHYIFKIFNWKIIAFQYCIGFCHTSVWISHGYMSPLSWNPLSVPTPLGCQRPPGLSSLCHSANSHWWSVLRVVVHMFQCYCFNLFILLHPHCVRESLLCLCLYFLSFNFFI